MHEQSDGTRQVLTREDECSPAAGKMGACLRCMLDLVLPNQDALDLLMLLRAQLNLNGKLIK